MTTTPSLETKYLGLDLRSPFLVGASPLTENLDALLELEAAGAGAVVMHSLFEEQLTRETAAATALYEASMDTFAEAASFFPASGDYALGPEEYLEKIARLKSRLRIPVIASLNGCTTGGWTTHADLIQQAGADAIQVVSLILREGVPAFAALVSGCREWMTRHEYENVSRMRGALSHKNSPDAAAFERANYLRTLQLWKA